LFFRFFSRLFFFGWFFFVDRFFLFRDNRFINNNRFWLDSFLSRCRFFGFWFFVGRCRFFFLWFDFGLGFNYCFSLLFGNRLFNLISGFLVLDRFFYLRLLHLFGFFFFLFRSRFDHLSGLFFRGIRLFGFLGRFLFGVRFNICFDFCWFFRLLFLDLYFSSFGRFFFNWCWLFLLFPNVLFFWLRLWDLSCWNLLFNS